MAETKQFKNLKSGNVVTVKNKKAIELMSGSSNYTAVTKQAEKAATKDTATK